MKTQHLILIILVGLLAAQCKKEQKRDYPCVGQESFYCKINGVPFNVWGSFPCPSYSSWYDYNSGWLVVGGTNCKSDSGEIRHVVVRLSEAFKTGKYEPVWKVSVGVDNSPEIYSLPYDSTLAGYVNLTELIHRNYSDDFTGGVVSGTFAFTLWNPDLNDTLYVTDGQFCVPRY